MLLQRNQTSVARDMRKDGCLCHNLALTIAHYNSASITSGSIYS